jgi:hypothetical protein
MADMQIARSSVSRSTFISHRFIKPLHRLRAGKKVSFIALFALIGILLILPFGPFLAQDAQTPPIIESLGPSSGPMLSIVRIKGLGFSLKPLDNVVIVGEAIAASRTLSEKEIEFIVPDGLTTGNTFVIVATRGLPSNQAKFTITESDAPDLLTGLGVNLDLSNVSYLGATLPRSSLQMRATAGGDFLPPGSLSFARGLFPTPFMQLLDTGAVGVGLSPSRAGLYATPISGKSGTAKETLVPNLTATTSPIPLVGATSNGLVSIVGTQVNFTSLPPGSGAVAYSPVFLPNPNFNARLAAGPSNLLLLPGVGLLTSNGFVRIVGGIPNLTSFPEQVGIPIAPPVPERNPNFSIASQIIGSPNPFLSSTLIVTSRGLVRIADGAASFIAFPTGSGRPIGSPVFQCNPNFNPRFGSGSPGSSLGEPFPFRSDVMIATTRGLIAISGKTADFIPAPQTAGRILSQPACPINPNFTVSPLPSPSLDDVRFYQSSLMLSAENGVVTIDGTTANHLPFPKEAGPVVSPPVFELNPAFNPFYAISPILGSPRPFLDAVAFSTTSGIVELVSGKLRFTALAAENGQVISPPLFELNEAFNSQFNPASPKGSPFPFADGFVLTTTDGLVRITNTTTTDVPGAVVSVNEEGAGEVTLKSDFMPLPPGAGMPLSPPIPTTSAGTKELMLVVTNGLVNIVGNNVEFIPLPDGANQVVGPPTVAPSGDILLAVANGLVQISGGKATFLPLPPQAGPVISPPTVDPNAGANTTVLSAVNGFAFVSGKNVQFFPLFQGTGQNFAPRAMLSAAIKANLLPVAEAGANQTIGAGTAALFDGSGSVDPDGTIVSYLWDFGDGTTGSGQFVNHTYPTPGSFTVTLTVSDDDGAKASDTAKIVVVDQTSPTVKVQSPFGGETVPAGSTLTIRWTSSDNVGVISHDVLLAADGVSFNTTIISGLSGFTQEFNWPTPTTLTATSARVRVIARDAAGNFGVGDSNSFAVRDTQPPSVTIQSPVGSETVSAGSTFLIRWFSSDNIAVSSHDITLATDGFNFNTTIVNGLSGFTQEFRWNVPTSLVTSSARIRITARDAAGNFAQSDSGFFSVRDTVSPSVFVSAPFNGQTLNAGSNFTIRWTANDNVGVVSQDIVLSTDGGFSFTKTIITNLNGNQTTFNWSVPLSVISNSAAVRVIARDAAGNIGQGDSGVFSIRDSDPPQVSVSSPRSGQVLNPGSTHTIIWTSSDNVGVISHDILLSTNAGRTFPTTIISGLGGGTQSFNWNVPANLNTTQARIRVRATDAAGNAASGDTLNFSVLDNLPPTVNVNAPFSGQTVAPGSTFRIQWFSTDNVDVVSHDVQFSSNGGQTYSTIASGLSGNAQSFDWSVPLQRTTQGRIRVVARDAGGNQGFGETNNFSIRDTVPPTVTVLAPTSGQTVSPGSVLSIKWRSSDNFTVTSHDIRLSTDGGASFPTVIASGLSGAQQVFDWSVPTNINTTRARIRVIASDADGNNGQDDSDQFAIRDSIPPSVTIQAPIGGEILAQGSQFTIRWRSSDDTALASHDIQLSTNGGSSFSNIASGLGGGQQTFNWTVPSNVFTTQAQVRIIARDFGGNTAQATSGNFTIQDQTPPSVNVTRPTSGNVVQGGSQFQIRWTSSDNTAVTSQDILLSTDGGNTFPTAIATNLSGTQQTFNWNVPTNVSSTQAVIRVTARDGAGNVGLDDSPLFTIQQPGVPPMVNLISPNGGEVITAGGTFNIRWSSSDDRGVVSHDLLLSVNGGRTFNTTIQTGVSGGAQSFLWNVPGNLSTSQARIRVIARDADGLTDQDDSNANFTIQQAGAPPDVRLLTPNGGQTITAGGSFNIQWVSSDDRGVVSHDLLLSTNGGQSFNTTIQTGLPGTAQSFLWSVPGNLSTSQARIRVIARDGDGMTAQDDSDANFTIQQVGPPPPGVMALVAANDAAVVGGLPSSGALVGTITTTGNSREIAVAPNGTYALAIDRDDNLSLITSFNTPGQESRRLDVGRSPQGIAISQDSSSAIVVSDEDNQVVVSMIVDLLTNPRVASRRTITGLRTTGVNDIALTPSGNTVVITSNSLVAVVDGVRQGQLTVRGLVPLAGAGIALSPDGDTAFIANHERNYVFVVRDVASTQRPSLVPTPPPATGRAPRAVRLTPDGRTLLVTNTDSNTVSVFRVSGIDLTLLTTLTVGDDPSGLAISPDGSFALVANSRDRTLSVITNLGGTPTVLRSVIGPANDLATSANTEQTVAIIPR